MTFKTARQLKISPELRKGLIWTLRKLEAGEFEKANHQKAEYRGAGFDMGVPADTGPLDGSQFECGTACCIAGWATVGIHKIKPDENGVFHLNQAVMDEAASLIAAERSHRDPLEKLFMGYITDRSDQLSLSFITTKQAAKALRSYLETGDPKWGRAVSKRSPAYSEANWIP